jgi:hypothetical protein
MVSPQMLRSVFARPIAIAFVVAGVVLGGSSVALGAQQADPTSVLTEVAASANWTTNTECIRMSVHVGGDDFVLKEGGVTVPQFRSYEVGVFKENICTGELLYMASDNLNGTAVLTVTGGWATFTADSFTLGAVGSEAPPGPLPASVHIRWRPIGGPTVTETVTHSNGSTIVDTLILRDAQATGSFVIAGQEFAAGPSTTAIFYTRRTVTTPQ